MRVYAAGPIQEGIKKTKRKVYYGDAQQFAVGFLEGLPVNRNICHCSHPCKYSLCTFGYKLLSK